MKLLLEQNPPHPDEDERMSTRMDTLGEAEPFSKRSRSKARKGVGSSDILGVSEALTKRIRSAPVKTKKFRFMGFTIRYFLDAAELEMFLANDVCDILGLAQPASSLRLLPDDEKGVHTVHTLGGPQKVVFVNEPGLYRLIFQSKKPEADKLKDFVFREVLPSLRRHGCYPAPEYGRLLVDGRPGLSRELAGYLPPEAASVVRLQHRWVVASQLKAISLCEGHGGGRRAACQFAAGQMRGRGFSWENIGKFWRKYEAANRDWRCLIPAHHKCGRRPRPALPAA